MDYSLLIGIHDCRQAVEEAADGRDEIRNEAHLDSDSEECDSGERFKNFMLFFIKVNIKKIFRWENTPPDSPRQHEIHVITPDDVYAITSQEGEC